MSRFTICMAEQRSPEWFAARLGRATGSIAAAIKAKAKTGNGEAVTRRNERVRLAIELLTGVAEPDDFMTADMKRGVLLEPKAIAAYEAHTGEMVRRTGFLSMRDCLAGCSLDFDVNNFEGFGEVKCPKAAVHIETIESRTVPSEHLPQIRHNFWGSGAKWCDFISFNDTVPEHLQLYVVRIERSEIEAEIKAYEPELKRFMAEVSLTVKKFREMKVAA